MTQPSALGWQVVDIPGADVRYCKSFIPSSRRGPLFSVLKKLPTWKNERLVMFGKERVLQRKTCLHGYKGLSYRYSGALKTVEPFTDEMLEIKQLIEKELGVRFDFVLLNYYPDGESYMGWHSDDEKEMVHGAPIASISLGAERKFEFKPKKPGLMKESKHSLVLASGSLLVMAGDTQTNFKHQLPKQTKVRLPRINLTFRCAQATQGIPTEQLELS